MGAGLSPGILRVTGTKVRSFASPGGSAETPGLLFLVREEKEARLGKRVTGTSNAHGYLSESNQRHRFAWCDLFEESSVKRKKKSGRRKIENEEERTREEERAINQRIKKVRDTTNSPLRHVFHQSIPVHATHAISQQLGTILGFRL